MMLVKWNLHLRVEISFFKTSFSYLGSTLLLSPLISANIIRPVYNINVSY